jgi:hypothetical protein
MSDAIHEESARRIEDYEVILRALGYALVEMRATDNLKKAQMLADVFHNVPAGISSRRPPKAIREKLTQTASRLGCEEYVTGLFEVVSRSLEK